MNDLGQQIHRDSHIESKHAMPGHFITTRSIDMELATTECQKQEGLKLTGNIVFIITMKT